MSSYTVFDLETVVDPRLPAPTPKACGAQVPTTHSSFRGQSPPFCDHLSGACPKCGAPPPAPFLPPSHHQVVVIGYGRVTAGLEVEEIGCLVPAEIQRTDDMPREAAAIGVLIAHLNAMNPVLVGWNSRRFDLPVLTARAFSYGLSFPWAFSERRGADPRYRYGKGPHWDLKDWLSGYGMGQAASLDVFAKSMGLPGKVGVDGSMVGAMVKEGRIGEVADYCACDVAQTMGCMFRGMLLAGLVERAAYRFAMQGLLSEIVRNDRLIALRSGLDVARLMLEKGEV